MKKVVRILAVAAIATASYSAYSTPTTGTLKDGTKIGATTAPRPICPVSICGNDPGLKQR